MQKRESSTILYHFNCEVNNQSTMYIVVSKSNYSDTIYPAVKSVNQN